MKKRIFLYLLLMIVSGCVMPMQKTKRLLPPFYKLDEAVQAVQSLDSYKTHTYDVDKKTPLHFVQVGDPNAKSAILFVHGSPGSWEAWAEYLQTDALHKKALMIAVDRPGYGGSDNDISGTSLEDQAKAIINAVKTSFPHQKKWVVVGHSYGGPVALRLAIDYPDNIESMLLLAPAISPDLVRVRFYNRLASLPIIRSILSKPLYRSNAEMYLLSEELALMKPKVRDVSKATTVIQGAKDGIVHPDNAVFAKEELVNSEVEIHILPKRGHFLPWEEYEFIRDKLLSML